MSGIKFVNITETDEGLKEKVRQWRNKEEIRSVMLTRHIISKEEHLKWLEGLKTRTDWKFWVVFVDEIPAGSVCLRDINYEKLCSEWGFYIGEDGCKGKGLGKAILFELLKMFFDEMNFKVLFTKTLSKNTTALRLYNKFRFKEIERAPFKCKEEIILFRFSKKDWMKFREELKDECRYSNRK